MTEITSGSGTLTRTLKQSDTVCPHYFNSFQNYCCGLKSKLVPTPSNKEFPPIPQEFKLKADEILRTINRTLIQRLTYLRNFTSVLPYEFFNSDSVIDYQRYLIDRAMFKMMSDTRVINWVSSLKKLYPVRTSGNGNCLLHAVLIAMVGVHDIDLYLRDALLQFMNNNEAVLKNSWKVERIKTDKMYGIQTENSKLDSEWQELCNLVRYENSDDGQIASNLQFLEAVHIFSISNMLSRPIIILSEDVVRNKHGEAISYNDLFGIYLPILLNPKECVRAPIVLAYDQSHFCPLQTNDKSTGSTSDNYLPLYQSFEHIRTKKLLPIRFLGHNITDEERHKLLTNYLNIKILSVFPETNGTPISVTCAELGNKQFSETDNFFRLYYDYIVDFFDIHKTKIYDDEDKRTREQDYYFSNPSSTEIIQRSTLNRDTVSPPPPYSSVINRLNDTKNNLIYERRPSYDKAVANGTVHAPTNDADRFINPYPELSQSQKPQNQLPIVQRGTINNDNQYSNGKQTPTKSDWELSDDDPLSNNKTSNNSNNSSRVSDSKLKQEQHQHPIRIPVNFVKSDSSSMNLIDFDQKTDRIRKCVLCKHLFDDLSSTGLCSRCFYTSQPNISRPPISLRSPPNIYSSNYKNSDFITAITPKSRLMGTINIYCPQCRHLNTFYNEINRLEFKCARCYASLRV